MTSPAAPKILLTHGNLRVAIAISAAPGAFWASRGPDGQPKGVSVDLARALAADMEVPLDLFVYENSSAITAAGARDEWDVTFIPMDDDRAKKIDFGPVYNVAESTFLVRPGVTIAAVPDVDKPGVKIAAVADTTTLRACAAWAKQTPVVGYATVDEIVEKLKAGEADAFAMSRDGLTTLAKEIPGSRVLPGQFFGAKTAVATPRGRPELLAYVTGFMQRAKTNGIVRRAYDGNGMDGAPVAE